MEKGQKQEQIQKVVVREFEARDEKEVQRIFSEGMEEMVIDTALRGLNHHPESLLLYLAITVSCLWVSWCPWLIVFLPVAILCARYFYSLRTTNSYTKRALSTDLANIERFYMRAPGSCLWVALLDGAVVGLVAAVHRSPEVVELKRMSVDSRYRCCGVGMALGQKVMEFASSQKYSKVILGTTNYTPAAHNLYKRLGFQCVGVTNGYLADSTGPGPSLLEWLFYRVRHHHYELKVQQKENVE